MTALKTVHVTYFEQSPHWPRPPPLLGLKPLLAHPARAIALAASSLLSCASTSHAWSWRCCLGCLLPNAGARFTSPQLTRCIWDATHALPCFGQKCAGSRAATPGERICPALARTHASALRQGPGGSASPSARPPWLLLASRRITSLAWRVVRHCRPGTAPVDVGCARTWARLACRVLTLALKATPKASVMSPARSSADRAMPNPNRCAAPFLCITHVWWSSGRMSSCQAGHCGGGTWEGRHFEILSSPAAISP